MSSPGNSINLRHVFECKDQSLESVSSIDESSLDSVQPALDYNEELERYAPDVHEPGSREVCTEYVALSDSSVLGHPFLNYPFVEDPGIEDPIAEPEMDKDYPPDGQELYLDVCKKMKIAAANVFYHELLSDVIDIKYYGVCEKGIRAMCLALVNNTTVTRLDLSSNYLSIDSCYHIGQLLKKNNVLQELLVSQCKIPTEGVRRLVANFRQREMDLLDISSNNIGDEGFSTLIDELEHGAIIKRLNASCNCLQRKTANALAENASVFSYFTHLDLSWNMLGIDQRSVAELISSLANLETLVELKLSYNNIDTEMGLTSLMLSNIKNLDLSINKFSSSAVPYIVDGIRNARKLKYLNLSANPFTPEDAMNLLKAFAAPKSKVLKFYLDNIDIHKPFLELMQDVKARRPKVTITHGRLVRDFEPSVPDLKQIVLKRLNYLSKPSKKVKLHFGEYFLALAEGTHYQDIKTTWKSLKDLGIPVDQELVEELANCFPGPVDIQGEKSINILSTCDEIRRMLSNLSPLSEEGLVTQKNREISMVKSKQK